MGMILSLPCRYGRHDECRATITGPDVGAPPEPVKNFESFSGSDTPPIVCTCECHGDGSGSAGIREPRRPKPDPSSLTREAEREDDLVTAEFEGE